MSIVLAVLGFGGMHKHGSWGFAGPLLRIFRGGPGWDMTRSLAESASRPLYSKQWRHGVPGGQGPAGGSGLWEVDNSMAEGGVEVGMGRWSSGTGRWSSDGPVQGMMREVVGG